MNHQKLNNSKREERAETETCEQAELEALHEPDADEEALRALKSELDERNDLLQRKQAEFENYRKRVRREREELHVASQAEVLQQLLPVLDALEKGLEALENESAQADLASYLAGYRLMLKELQALLDKFNVSEVPGPGAAFDPNLHEAVVSEASREHDHGTILEQFRKGYAMGERLIRAAQVKVAVEPEDESVAEIEAGGEGADGPS